MSPLDPCSPSDCALAVGLPLTREAFLGQLSPGYPGDFARSVVCARPRAGVDPEAYWTTDYGPVAGVVERVCSRVERLGVRVVRAARRADLGGLLRRYRVVTVVAHWRFVGLGADDLLDPAGLLAELTTPRILLQQQIARAVAVRAPELLADGPGQDRARAPEVLLEALNSMIADAHRGYHRGGVGDCAAHEEVLQRLTRPALEEAFPTLVRAAGSVELADGMHTVGEFVGEVPLDFAGVLDLSVCNSVLLGHAVKRIAPECLVANNRYPADLARRITLYRLVIEQLSRRSGSYPDAMSFVHEHAGKER